jgi:hypothetical protein
MLLLLLPLPLEPTMDLGLIGSLYNTTLGIHTAAAVVQHKVPLVDVQG